jgi:hypothetical protein
MNPSRRSFLERLGFVRLTARRIPRKSQTVQDTHAAASSDRAIHHRQLTGRHDVTYVTLVRFQSENRPRRFVRYVPLSRWSRMPEKMSNEDAAARRRTSSEATRYRPMVNDGDEPWPLLPWLSGYVNLVRHSRKGGVQTRLGMCRSSGRRILSEERFLSFKANRCASELKVGTTEDSNARTALHVDPALRCLLYLYLDDTHAYMYTRIHSVVYSSHRGRTE